MKTTLVIDDGVMARLREEAARSGRTISELVETALRMLLEPRPKQKKPRAFPTFRGGPLLVDIADRDALYRAMEQEPPYPRDKTAPDEPHAAGHRPSRRGK